MEQPREAATRPTWNESPIAGRSGSFRKTPFRRSSAPSSAGLTAIELDVHATADGVVVVHHDPGPVRGLAAGSNAIAELDWREVRMVELGARS